MTRPGNVVNYVNIMYNTPAAARSRAASAAWAICAQRRARAKAKRRYTRVSRSCHHGLELLEVNKPRAVLVRLLDELLDVDGEAEFKDGVAQLSCRDLACLISVAA